MIERNHGPTHVDQDGAEGAGVVEKAGVAVLKHRPGEVVEGLEGTNESIISHRQNDVLRQLTIFSVILLPLTLITGIFGMNVDFPGFGSAAAFWVIVGLMAGTIAGLVGFFRYKRWL